MVGDAHITRIARHQPLQPLEVLIRRQRSEQRVRTGILGRVVVRLERDLQQDLMTGGAGLGHELLERTAVGGVSDADRRGQPFEHLAAWRIRQAEPVDQHRNARRTPHGGLGMRRGARIDLSGALAVERNLRQRTVLRVLHEVRRGHRRQRDGPSLLGAFGLRGRRGRLPGCGRNCGLCSAAGGVAAAGPRVSVWTGTGASAAVCGEAERNAPC